MFRSYICAVITACAAAAGTGDGNGGANCTDITLIDDADGTLNLCYYYKEGDDEIGEFHGDLNYVSKSPM